MRVITGDDVAIIGGLGLLALIGAGAAVGTTGYWLTWHPAFLPIVPAIIMGFAIGAMDRTTGDARRAWAWVAIGAGVLAVLAILAT